MDHNTDVTMRGWMNDHRLNNRRLNDLAIPGTHDSGTFPLGDSGLENGIGKTQAHDVAAQLEAGIRYFDIRVNADNMTINHGPTKTNYALADITIPVMSQLRGKLVYLRGYGVDDHAFIRADRQDGPTSGIPVDRFARGTDYNAWSKSPGGKTWQQYFDSHGQEAWPDNEGNYDIADTDFRNRHGLSFVIQDWYSINIVHGVSYEAQCKSEIDVVKLYHDAAVEKSKDSLFLNFVSVSQAAYRPREYAVGPSHCNERLLALLNADKRRGQRGTYLLDFYDQPAGLVRAIVDMNFIGL